MNEDRPENTVRPQEENGHADPEETYRRLGLAEVRPPTPIGRFRRGVRAGDLFFVSGTYGTVKNESGDDVLPIAGKLGRELSVADGYRSARLVAVNLLAMARAELGSLDRIGQVVRLAGYVNCVPGFAEAPAVLDGASDLLVEVFGEDRGGHARIALYQSDLPREAPVACELTLHLQR
ncbi:RidA family protein [Actinomadura oligospora]|uniref:RidA family protein n=1 Tax=Actinomadura oligospora TaxID=111804 RepID=UPI0004BA4ABF|nr:RidA family protein [Actinomadura oligospora]